MVHGRIWPAHPKPLPDELLSSWIVRVAQANGIKLQTLCWMLFGNERSPWNRDIDRSAPKWLLKAMCEHTGTNYWDAYHTTLTTYRTILFPSRRRSVRIPVLMIAESSDVLTRIDDYDRRKDSAVERHSSLRKR